MNTKDKQYRVDKSKSMAYNKMVFIETSVFTGQVQGLFDDDSYRRLQLELMLNPRAGDVIQGTGGLRKLRWSASGRGKRGGTRIIYYYQDREATVYMLLAYPKSRKDDLTAQEKKTLTRIVQEMLK